MHSLTRNGVFPLRLDYRDRDERIARSERTRWGNGMRLTRAQFEEDMRALHD